MNIKERKRRGANQREGADRGKGGRGGGREGERASERERGIWRSCVAKSR